MTTADLTDFLLARIAEDQALARAATSGQWEPDDEGCCIYSPEVGILAQVAIGGGDGTEADVTHIARHAPGRVLAECEAKRRIVEYAQQAAGDLADWPDGSPARVIFDARDSAYETVLRALALPYAEHAEYRPE